MCGLEVVFLRLVTHTHTERLTLKFDVFVWISNQPSMSIARMNASNNKKKFFSFFFRFIYKKKSIGMKATTTIITKMIKKKKLKVFP